MSEVWYDLRDGAVLIGAEAAAERLDEAGPEIVPLKELITAKERPAPRPGIEKHQGRDWTREKLIELGRWTLSVLDNSDEKPVKFTFDMLDNLHALGLGPSPRSCLRNKLIRNLRDFRISIGALPGDQTPGAFDSWTTQDFINYARIVEKNSNGRPKEQDYIQTARTAQFDAPTPLIIAEHLGGYINDLNEHLGYPNISTWVEEDYTDFGVKVIEVNGPELFKKVTLDILSAKDRGPSQKTIVNKFGSWEKYKNITLEQYIAKEKERAADIKTKVNKYRQMIKNAELTEQYDTFNDEELLRYGARFSLIERIAPELWFVKKRNIASLETSDDFVAALEDQSSVSTVGAIEFEAERMGIYDDIWPMDDNKKYLVVSPEEIETELEKKRDKQRAYRKFGTHTPTFPRPSDPQENSDSLPISITEVPGNRYSLEKKSQEENLSQELNRINDEITKTYEAYTAFIGSADYNANGQDVYLQTLERLERQRNELLA